MKAIYDKVLLVLSALLVVGSGAYYYTNLPDADIRQRSLQATGGDYEPIEFAFEPRVSVDWADPATQSTGWVFDVFTPPKIYIDPETKAFIRIPPRAPADAEPFGIYLVRIERELYRFQFQGYAEVDPGNPATSIIYIFDTVNNRQINARSGRDYPDAGFAIKHFTTERLEVDGIITREAVVTLLDKDMDKEIEMRQNEVIYTGKTRFHFASREYPDFSFVATEVGETFSSPSGVFQIMGIDLANQSVTIEKNASSAINSQTQILTPQSSANIAPVAPTRLEPTPEKTSNEMNNIFDGFF
jgi:hypothetical protein